TRDQLPPVRPQCRHRGTGARLRLRRRKLDRHTGRRPRGRRQGGVGGGPQRAQQRSPGAVHRRLRRAGGRHATAGHLRPGARHDGTGRGHLRLRLHRQPGTARRDRPELTVLPPHGWHGGAVGRHTRIGGLQVTTLHLDRDDDALEVSYGKQQLLRYVYRPTEAQLESPRPFFHPLRTLVGDCVSLYRPHDHVWHKGIAWSLPNVGPENFWGGPTYVRDKGYVQLPNNGATRHREFVDLRADDEGVR